MTNKNLFIFVCIVIVLAGCGSRATPTPAPTAAVQKITLMASGSGTVTSLLEAVKPALEADVPGLTLQVLPGTGTSEGVKGVISGTFDIATMTRAAKDSETSAGVEYVEIGQTAVAVFVHPDVKVTNLTKAQVIDIFAGKIKNWSEVGGPQLDLVLFVRDEGDGSTQALRELILGDAPFPEKATVFTSQTDMQNVVAGTPGSVGFGSWATARATGAKLKGASLDGVAPGDPGYPIRTPVGIGYLAGRKADVSPLVDWLLSETGQAALRKFDVLPK